MIQLAIQAEVMKPVKPAVQAEEIKLEVIKTVLILSKNAFLQLCQLNTT